MFWVRVYVRDGVRRSSCKIKKRLQILIFPELFYFTGYSKFLKYFIKNSIHLNVKTQMKTKIQVITYYGPSTVSLAGYTSSQRSLNQNNPLICYEKPLGLKKYVLGKESKNITMDPIPVLFYFNANPTCLLSWTPNSHFSGII